MQFEDNLKARMDAGGYPTLYGYSDTMQKELTSVTCFYVGGYGGFDRIAASAVKQVKQRHPEIILMLVLPYHPAERPVEIPYGFDGTYYPEGLENIPADSPLLRQTKSWWIVWTGW